MAAITEKEILKQLSDRGYFEADFPLVGMWITKRPHYCNRGAYQWNVETKDHTKITIDGADMFPRYYFFLDSMVKEINAWIEKRKIDQ